MDWFRWYHGTTTDPKWRVIARRAGLRVGDVVAVWATMLEAASETDSEGELGSWCAEDIAAALDLETEQVQSIVAAMQGKVLDTTRLTGWRKRQPKREDDSTDRVRRYRDRKREESADVTQSNAVKRTETLEESRGDKKRERGGARASRMAPADWEPTDEHRSLAIERGADFDLELAKFRDHTFREAKTDWDATFRNWLRRIDPPARNGKHPVFETTVYLKPGETFE